MDDVERVPRLTRDEFAERFLRSGPPVVVTDDLAEWAGATPRTFEELRTRWGDRTVPAWVTSRGEWSYASSRQTMPFSDLIDAALIAKPGAERISGPQLDLHKDVPWASEDVSAPPFIPIDRALTSNLWVQAAGDKTHLHWDEDPGVLGLLRGEKEIVLFAPSDWRNLYPIGAGPGANWSRVDFWRPDEFAFPRYREARPIRVTLHAGEMLFVPVTWWHSVHTTQPSISLNSWWTEPTAETSDVYRRLIKFSHLVGKAGAERGT